jgi:PTS system mannose-specific IIA component
MVRAIILTHGTVGQALLEAVEKILGPQTGVEVVSNEGLSLEQITQTVESRLDGSPTVLFVDFCGGSPYVAGKSLHEHHLSAAMVTGVNLPMLFSFFTKRNQLPFAELVTTVETDGHRGIQRLSA